MTKEYTAALRRWRQKKHIYLTDIAEDMGKAVSTISRFERGQINSADILLWYIMRGAPLPDEEVLTDY